MDFSSLTDVQLDAAWAAIAASNATSDQLAPIVAEIQRRTVTFTGDSFPNYFATLVAD